MEKAYYSMTCRFYPDKNIGLDTTEMMSMINEAKDGLEDTLSTNDAIREEYRVRAAEDKISISYDENSDSESSDTLYEPATSSSKASTLPAKHTNDNEETHLKYNSLIVSKTSFFDVHGQGWVFFKGVSLLSLVCLAGNVDALLDNVAGLDDVLLDSES